MLKRFPIALGAALFLIGAQASAQDVTVRPIVGVDFPVTAGGGVDVEHVSGLRLTSTIGLLPHSFVDASNSILVPIFEDYGYDQYTADLVAATLENSMLWRTAVGYRPWPESGFVVGAGYTVGGLGGSASAAEVLEALVHTEVPDAAGDALVFDASAVIHIAHLEFGWTQDLAQGLWLHGGLGFGYLFAAKSEVSSQTTPRQASAQEALSNFEAEVEAFLDDTLVSYVHPPHLRVVLGWEL